MDIFGNQLPPSRGDETVLLEREVLNKLTKKKKTLAA